MQSWLPLSLGSACSVYVVSYSPAFKWCISLLLPLTLVCKSVGGRDPSLEFKDKLIEFLVHNELDVVTVKEWMDAMPVIHATAGTCRMLVAEVSSDGWTQHLIRYHAEATDHVFFIFRGKVYAEQPTWLTAAAGLWSRQLQRLGLNQYVTSVVAVIASESCNAERLPWDKLNEH